MPTWRCPYCGTPQAETARCWVCRRSTTSCFTCRHFRRGVAAQLGYCGRDRTREVLTGSEQRDCWERPASRPSEPADGTDEAPRQPGDPLPTYGLWAVEPVTAETGS